MFLFGLNEVWRCIGEATQIKTASSSRRKDLDLLWKSVENDEIKIAVDPPNLLWSSSQGDR
jgi:hypothetical protein